MCKQRKNEQGQAIVILTLGMVALLLFAGLAIDGGNMYANRRIAQNAADAGALVGSQKLLELCSQNPPSNDWTQIYYPVGQYVASNAGAQAGAGSTGSSYSVYFIDSQGNRLYGGLTIDAVQAIPCGCVNGQSVGFQATGVEVDVNKTFNSFLAGLIGRGRATASAGAKSNYGVTTPTSANQFKWSDVYPIAVPAGTYNVDDPIQLFDDTPGPGNFGWLSWRDVNDAPSLRNELGMGNAPSYSPIPPDTVANYVNPDTGGTGTALSVGMRVSGGPGLKNGDVSQLFDGRTIVVPLYDPDPKLTNGQGSHYNYYITGWLAISLHSYDKRGQHSFMTATVKQYVSQGDFDSTASTCPKPKFCTTKLTR